MTKSKSRFRDDRSSHSYNRRGPSREQQKRILIACEGDSERLYFESLSQANKLQTVVVIECACGGYAGRVVELAIEQRDKAKKEENPFDIIWCVFDTEGIDQKEEFLKAIANAKKREFNLAISNPCVEYWFILHFEQTTASLANADDAVKRLKIHEPDYEKSLVFMEKFVPQRILPKTNTAIKHAKSCLAEVEMTNTENFPNPCTTLHNLIEEFEKLRQNKPYNS